MTVTETNKLCSGSRLTVSLEAMFLFIVGDISGLPNLSVSGVLSCISGMKYTLPRVYVYSAFSVVFAEKFSGQHRH